MKFVIICYSSCRKLIHPLQPPIQDLIISLLNRGLQPSSTLPSKGPTLHLLKQISSFLGPGICTASHHQICEAAGICTHGSAFPLASAEEAPAPLKGRCPLGCSGWLLPDHQFLPSYAHSSRFNHLPHVRAFALAVFSAQNLLSPGNHVVHVPTCCSSTHPPSRFTAPISLLVGSFRSSHCNLTPEPPSLHL